MLIQRFKSPQDTLDFPLDWSDWLTEFGGTDTIASSVWMSWLYSGSGDQGSALTLGADLQATNFTVIWLSNGRPGEVWAIRNTITTTLGRTKEYTFLVAITPFYAAP